MKRTATNEVICNNVADYPMPQELGDPDSYECEHVALGVLPNGNLDIVFTASYPNWACTGSDCWRMYEITGSGAPTSAWTSVQMTSMKSKRPPSILTCGNTAHLIHGGYSTPDAMWWSYRDATAWSDNVQMPSRYSVGGGALGCYQGNRAILAHGNANTPGTNRQLLWSEYGP